MNICFIPIDYHKKESGGGIASYVDTVSKELIKRGHNVIIIVQSFSRFPQIIEKGNLKIYSVPFGNIHYYLHKVPFLGKRISAPIRQIEWSFTIWVTLRKILKKYSIDIIETQEIGNLLIKLFLKRIPIIIKTHGAPYTIRKFSGEKIYVGDKLDRLMERWCLRRASVIIAPSKFQAQEISKELELNGDKIRVIPHPISHYFLEETEREIHIQKDEKIVLYTGRIEYRKGVLTFLKCIPYVIKKEKNVKFVLAGGYHVSLSPERVKRVIKEEDISHYVKLLGHTEWKSLPRLYRKSSIFVMPSYYETFSISCIEAMVLGLPVVATKTCALPEVVEDGLTGILVPPGDPLALAEAIIHLLQDPDLRRRMGGAGRKRVLEKFTVEQVIEQILAVYQKVMEVS